jgi:hypothetical protein
VGRYGRPGCSSALGDLVGRRRVGLRFLAHVAVQSDRVYRDLGARYAAIDDHVEQVVFAIEAVDVHTTLAITIPQRCQARSLRVIHPLQSKLHVSPSRRRPIDICERSLPTAVKKGRAAPKRCPPDQNGVPHRGSRGIGVLFTEVERLEARVAAVGGEVDGAPGSIVDHERVAVQFGEPG